MEKKLENLEKKHKSLISFVNKTMDLFQSYLEYNQMIVSEFQQLKQLSKVFELELEDAGSEFNASCSMPINTSYPENAAYINNRMDAKYENKDKQISADYQQSFDNINKQILEHRLYFTYDAEEEQMENTPYLPEFSNFARSEINGSNMGKLKPFGDSMGKKDSFKSYYNTEGVGFINDHEMAHRKERPFCCYESKINFKHSSYFSRHSKYHHVDQDKLHPPKPKHLIRKPYKCDKCTASFVSKSSLIIHQRVHTGERPFKCLICGMSFNVLCNYKRHQRSKNHFLVTSAGTR